MRSKGSKNYSTEFRSQVVSEVTGGAKVKDVAAARDIKTATVYAWLVKHKLAAAALVEMPVVDAETVSSGPSVVLPDTTLKL